MIDRIFFRLSGGSLKISSPSAKNIALTSPPKLEEICRESKYLHENTKILLRYQTDLCAPGALGFGSFFPPEAGRQETGKEYIQKIL